MAVREHSTCPPHRRVGKSDCCCCHPRVIPCAEMTDPLGSWERMARSPTGPLYEAKRKNAQPERELQSAVKEWLTLKGITFLELVVKPSVFYDQRQQKTVRRASPMAGWPDLNLIVNGRYGGCELKVKSSQSDAQREAQRRIEAGGGIYRLCRSIEDVQSLINELMR